MSMLELRHYTIRLRESQRLRYRLPRLAWSFLVRGLSVVSGARGLSRGREWR